MATISFDLVSPENLIFNEDVGTIIVPGKDGDLGVLPGHSQVMSSLRPGRVMVYSCLLYTSPSPRDYAASRMPSSA